MKKKALFFDIDGTLLSEVTHEIPASALRALKEARAAGHLVFINSGRVISHVDPIRKLVEADGFLCGCGTYIMVNNQVLYSKSIPHERGVQIKKDILAHGLDGILEGEEGCYFRKETSWIPEVERIRKALEATGSKSPYGWEEDCYDFAKFCILSDEHSDTQGLFRTLPDMDIIDRGNSFYECVPSGHSKATAIAFILEYFNLPLENAYVFGDSMNDLAMFEYVPNAVLMGKHDAELEPYASYITKTVEEDGVACAMKALGII